MKWFRPTAMLMAMAAIAPSCVRQAGQGHAYLPTEEGLTLLFENPESKTPSGAQDFVQLRVNHTKQTSEGLEVACGVTTFQGADDIVFLYQQDGGIYSISPTGNKSTVLPPGFPNKTTAWQAGGINYRVIGRAKADIPGVSLPESIGVWVEAMPVQTQLSNPGNEKAHILFLPGIGEAETKVLRQGAWATINRLVGRGFTDTL